MPRPTGSAKTPKYCHHKGKGLAYVTLGGRPVYLGPYGSKESRAAYDRIVGEFLASGRVAAPGPAGAPPPGEALTVSMLLAAFWESAKRDYPAPTVGPKERPSGELGNFWDVAKPLRRVYGSTPAAKFGPLALKNVRNEFVRVGWCRNVVNRQTSRVKFIFKWAVANELVPPSVYQGLATVAGLRAGRSEARESDPVKPVPEHVLADTLPLMGRHVRAMAELQLCTGMRPGELCLMRTADLDTAGKVWVYRPPKHKTQHHGHVREIRIGKRGQAILEQFIRPDLTGFIFSPAQAEAERHAAMRLARKTPVQPSQVSRAEQSRRRRRARAPQDHYTVASYRRAIARACDEADRWAKGGVVIGDDERLIPRWHPHQLRHNFATQIRREYGPEAALVLLGDKTTRMVDVYAEKDARTAEQIIAEVG